MEEPLQDGLIKEPCAKRARASILIKSCRWRFQRNKQWKCQHLMI